MLYILLKHQNPIFLDRFLKALDLNQYRQKFIDEGIKTKAEIKTRIRSIQHLRNMGLEDFDALKVCKAMSVMHMGLKTCSDFATNAKQYANRHGLGFGKFLKELQHNVELMIGQRAVILQNQANQHPQQNALNGKLPPQPQVNDKIKREVAQAEASLKRIMNEDQPKQSQHPPIKGGQKLFNVIMNRDTNQPALPDTSSHRGIVDTFGDIYDGYDGYNNQYGQYISYDNNDYDASIIFGIGLLTGIMLFCCVCALFVAISILLYGVSRTMRKRVDYNISYNGCVESDANI